MVQQRPSGAVWALVWTVPVGSVQRARVKINDLEPISNIEPTGTTISLVSVLVLEAHLVVSFLGWHQKAQFPIHVRNPDYVEQKIIGQWQSL